jgi:hypothetical protein
VKPAAAAVKPATTAAVKPTAAAAVKPAAAPAVKPAAAPASLRESRAARSGDQGRAEHQHRRQARHE